MRLISDGIFSPLLLHLVSRPAVTTPDRSILRLLGKPRASACSVMEPLCDYSSPETTLEAEFSE